MARRILDYAAIKSAVSMRQVLDHFGMDVRQNLALCPFHPDKKPSMHVYADHFYCFSCGVGGDVINFVARLQGIRNAEAAQIVAGIGGLSAPQDDYRTRVRFRERAQERRKAEAKQKALATRYDALCAELRRLKADATQEPFSDPWCAAMMRLPACEHEAQEIFEQMGEFNGTTRIYQGGLPDSSAI